MSNYTILQLNAKDLSELKDIATELGLKVSNSAKKESLVYEILDQQAVTNAQRKTITNEKQELDRKKRLRVPIKKTPEQLVTDQNNTPKPTQEIAAKAILEVVKDVSKKIETVSAENKSESEPIPPKKQNKQKQKPVKKHVIIILELVIFSN